MSFSETISPFFGRCAFVYFYLSSAADIMGNWQGIAADLTARHVPLPPLVLLVGLVLTFLGGISLLFGYHTRHGAVMLFAMTIIAAFGLHDFWHYSDAAARSAQFAIFIRDFAICGGLLLLVGMGPGPFAVDNNPKSGGKKR
jgi:putative oxidoreductase